MKIVPTPPPVDLKAYFCGCALVGRLASQEDATFNSALERIVDEAYQLGELLFERYIEENPPSDDIKRFNRKLGL